MSGAATIITVSYIPEFRTLEELLEWAGDLVSRDISALNGVTLIIALLITNFLSPLPLQVGV